MYKIINRFHIKEIKRYHHYIHKCDYVFAGHRHPGIELNIILDGEMEIACETGIYKVKKGEMLLINSYSFHQNRVIGNQCAEMIVVQFDTDNTILWNNVCICNMDNKANSLISLFCEEMETRSKIKNGRYLEIPENAIKLFEVFMQSLLGNEQVLFIKKNNDSPTYTKAVEYMREHISDKLTTSEIAKHCCVCSTTLKKLFSYYTSKGCISFFNEMKLEQSKEMLLEGKSCLEISNALGFSSQGYFSRAFKKMYAISPVQYKNDSKRE